MWPWEHLAVGYLCYSLFARVRYGRAPRAVPVVALAVGTQFPDLVDKPLAWTFGVLPSGHSLAHSALVAVPLALLAVTLGRRAAARNPTSDFRGAGTAFAVGYLSHLPGDVFYPVIVGGKPNVGFLLWPLVPAAESPTSVGFLEIVRLLFARFVGELFSGAFSTYLALELGLLLCVFALWLADGVPPFGALVSRRERRREETT
ncbi:metal-dependent hydrolase [Halorussus halophilus]|uniref:metal-dependent hydrolase n=1 Tax=Halorussus halophilus TaxID=2650975 RepID=UPI001301693D|nr:metal-dependent hydrolase [Halorussus halophilus]